MQDVLTGELNIFSGYRLHDRNDRTETDFLLMEITCKRQEIQKHVNVCLNIQQEMNYFIHTEWIYKKGYEF